MPLYFSLMGKKTMAVAPGGDSPPDIQPVSEDLNNNNANNESPPSKNVLEGNPRQTGTNPRIFWKQEQSKSNPTSPPPPGEGRAGRRGSDVEEQSRVQIGLFKNGKPVWNQNRSKWMWSATFKEWTDAPAPPVVSPAHTPAVQGRPAMTMAPPITRCPEINMLLVWKRGTRRRLSVGLGSLGQLSKS